MFRKSFDLTLAAILAIIALVMAFAGVSGPALIIPGALLVFYLPGYALTQVFGADRPKWLLPVSLSLLVTLAGGILLNLLPVGLQAGSWAVWLGGLTLAATGIALVRRATGPELYPALPKIKVNPLPTALAVVAGLILVAAYMVAWTGAAAPTGSFTQLWLLPATATQPGQTAVRLGLSNQESGTVKYRLVLETGNTVAQEWTSLEIAPGQEWGTTATLPAGAATVKATLYRLDTPGQVYRQVFLAANP